MTQVKKLIFAPIFLIIFAFLLYQLVPFLKSYDLIFSITSETLIQLIIISLLFCLSSYFFVLFASLAGDLKISLIFGVFAVLLSLLFLDFSLALVFMVATIISIVVVSINLNAILQSYLNFKPAEVLGSSIKLLAMLLILSFCVVYFLSMNKIIARNGFQIPDSLIDTALKLSPGGIPQEVALPSTLIKQAVKDQLQNIIKPYVGFVPAALAILLFFALQFFTSIINIFISPLLSLTFFILEKTGFTKYEIEKREVKKLVV